MVPCSRCLNPVFEIGGEQYIMVTQSIAAVPKKVLGLRAGALGGGNQYDVTNAFDMLLSDS